MGLPGPSRTGKKSSEPPPGAPELPRPLAAALRGRGDGGHARLGAARSAEGDQQDRDERERDPDELPSPDPLPQDAYRSYRYSYAYGSAAYHFDDLVAGAAYRVRFHLVEDSYDSAGQRSNNLSLNGAIVCNGLDIYAQTGAKYKALAEEFRGPVHPDLIRHVERVEVHDFAPEGRVARLGRHRPPPGAARGRRPVRWCAWPAVAAPLSGARNNSRPSNPRNLCHATSPSMRANGLHGVNSEQMANQRS